MEKTEKQRWREHTASRIQKFLLLRKNCVRLKMKKQDSEDIVRTLLVETDSYDESLSQTGDVSSDLKNQLQHLRIMIAAAKEQYDHRLIGVTSIQRDETEMNTDRRLTAQIQSESIIETRRGAYINKIKDTIATLEDHLKIIRSARIGDELQNICSVLDVQIPNVNREQARDLHYMET
ncbi:unnamed protein product [Mytilus edulis]|uniref:Uncharacterized protein n=1 Tax=Mytilus edulis TaxID=6550 RepID=A0A8S3U0T4_MYTED|nr:unnamed protein product [Mytilus edulis]